jgi:hypothetical protein
MGEAKRRKQSDPDYGKKPQGLPSKTGKKGSRLGLDKVSKGEWIVWAVLLGMLAATFAATRAM